MGRDDIGGYILESVNITNAKAFYRDGGGGSICMQSLVKKKKRLGGKAV